jgi:hypothetical protein
MPIVVLAATGGLASAAYQAHATTAVVRYASPTGVASATCPHAAPCDLLTAVNQAPDGTTVVVESGTYDKATPLTTSLTDHNGPLDIRGPARGPRPVIYTAASPGLYFGSSNVSNLAVMAAPGDGSGLLDYHGTVDHVLVKAASGNACAAYNVLADSLCVATGVHGLAIELYINTGGPGTSQIAATLRGDTGIATDPSGYGLALEATGPSSITTAATNDVFKGGAKDVLVEANTSNAAATATIDHSDFATRSVLSPTGGSADISSTNSDTAVSPRFVDAATGNYRELASSPTVDAGGQVPAKATDLAGNPRTSGGVADMGAFEFLRRPTAHKLTVVKPAAHAATLSLLVDAQGLVTTVTLRVTHGRHHVSKTYAAGAAATARKRHFVLRHLKPGTTYTVTAVARNAGGKSATLHRKVHTKR